MFMGPHGEAGQSFQAAISLGEKKNFKKEFLKKKKKFQKGKQRRRKKPYDSRDSLVVAYRG
jgi:hypothetical protein